MAGKRSRDFAIQLDKEFEGLVEEQIVLATQKISFEGLQRVVMKSPVDTGRFRGNWNVSIGRRDLTVTPNLDKSGRETMAKGQAIIDGLQDIQVVYLTNNLPYAGRLEDGWSMQAPTGMVAVTVTELETMFSRME